MIHRHHLILGLYRFITSSSAEAGRVGFTAALIHHFFDFNGY
jgi:hypothetical protein